MSRFLRGSREIVQLACYGRQNVCRRRIFHHVGVRTCFIVYFCFIFEQALLLLQLMDVFRKAAAMRSSVAETNPTSVYLVSCDHKGAKLLFRYPFHALEEPVRTMSVMDRKRSLHRDADTVSNRQKTQNLAPLTDDVVANLLAVNDRMCGRKFELTVKDVRFVGHPMLIQTGGFCDKKKRVKSPILIHIVFALNASARHQVVDCYYELSKALAIALGHEENRCVYLTSQVRHMVNIHDTVIEKW